MVRGASEQWERRPLVGDGADADFDGSGGLWQTNAIHNAGAHQTGGHSSSQHC